ncbi:hypothetical protein N657DRAFT_423383 [Parathielavia appendiculata]|uniref:Uncharacterized protein n=1 Tax=Parathielavia appendiculata TaxID=2587402 RepID=A0AAN6U1X5_9PEZI|nr:hypothetical protein N657DRAFT_423383 [Parathielavia appendiculata]
MTQIYCTRPSNLCYSFRLGNLRHGKRHESNNKTTTQERLVVGEGDAQGSIYWALKMTSHPCCVFAMRSEIHHSHASARILWHWILAPGVQGPDSRRNLVGHNGSRWVAAESCKGSRYLHPAARALDRCLGTEKFVLLIFPPTFLQGQKR